MRLMLFHIGKNRGTVGQFNKSYGYRALPPGPRTILFISEPLEGSPDNPYDGYTEKKILDHIIYAAEYIAAERVAWNILVWVPQAQSLQDFYYLNWWSGKTKIIITKKHLPGLLHLADLVIGMGSKDLETAVEFQRPVISVQPRLKREDAFMPNIIGASFPVYRIIDLIDSIIGVMYSTRVRRKMFEASLLQKSIN